MICRQKKLLVCHSYPFKNPFILQSSLDFIGRHVFIADVLAIDIAGNRGEASDEICGTVKPDKEAPVVTGISPGETVIGANPTLKILATDNAAFFIADVFPGKPDITVFPGNCRTLNLFRISPGETVIGANPTLKILATDNAALKSVQVEFREEGEGIWHEIATLSAQGRVKYE